MISREHIYANKEFILDSKRAYDCLREVLEYGFNVDFLKQIEYEHALRLLRPQATLYPNTSPKKLASEWGISWDEIASFNGISDVRPVKRPITLVIPISREVAEGFVKDEGGDFVYHVIQEGDTLDSISKKFIKTYPDATPDYIREHNNNLRARAPISASHKERWQEVTDGPLIPGKYIDFEALEIGRSSYLREKYIPCMGDVPIQGAHKVDHLPFGNREVILPFP